MYYINDEPTEVTEIRCSSSTLCDRSMDRSDVTFRHFSSIWLTLLVINKSNIRSENLTLGSSESDRQELWTNPQSFFSSDAATTSQVIQSECSVGRGDDERVATVAPVKARRHSHGSPGDKNQATGVNNNNLNLRGEKKTYDKKDISRIN